MKRTTGWFLAGAVLSPLVLVSLKLIVFMAGIVSLVWITQTAWVLFQEDEENDDSGNSVARKTPEG